MIEKKPAFQRNLLALFNEIKKESFLRQRLQWSRYLSFSSNQAQGTARNPSFFFGRSVHSNQLNPTTICLFFLSFLHIELFFDCVCVYACACFVIPFLFLSGSICFAFYSFCHCSNFQSSSTVPIASSCPPFLPSYISNKILRTCHNLGSNKKKEKMKKKK